MCLLCFMCRLWLPSRGKRLLRTASPYSAVGYEPSAPRLSLTRNWTEKRVSLCGRGVRGPAISFCDQGPSDNRREFCLHEQHDDRE